MKDLSSSSFFVPVVDAHSPVAYSIINDESVREGTQEFDRGEKKRHLIWVWHNLIVFKLRWEWARVQNPNCTTWVTVDSCTRTAVKAQNFIFVSIFGNIDGSYLLQLRGCTVPVFYHRICWKYFREQFWQFLPFESQS